MGIELENLGFAASLLAAVVPRRRATRNHETQLPGEIQRQVGTVICVCTTRGIVQYISPNATHVLGDAADRAADLGLDLVTLLQPENAIEVDQLIVRCASNRSGQPLTFELLTRAPAGGTRRLEVACRTLEPDAGGPGFLLELRDLREHQHTLLSGGLQYLSESAIVTDRTGSIRYVNPAFEAVTGYSSHEVLGRTPALLKSGAHSSEFYGRLWRTISECNTWRGELCNRRKDGTLYHEEMRIIPICDATGAITHFISTSRDISERKLAELRGEDSAFFDPLTGVSTPRLMKERSRQILALARRHGHTAALLHVDIDGLPAVNESHGETVGDEVLRRIAERLRQGLRESDSVGRVGPHEFLIMLSEVAEEDATARVVRRVRNSICRPFKIQEHTITINATIGVALYPQDATTYDELTEYSRLALGRAQSAHHGVEFYRRGLTDLTNERLTLEDDLRWAWERKQFVLHYQPIAELSSGDMVGAEALARGQMIGVEALARWPHLERGIIEPAQFIPLAERTGRIVALDRWAIATAARQAAAWSKNGWRGWISVNLSARSLHDSDLASYLVDCMQQYEIEPGRIVLEVTESAAMRDVEVTARILRQLKDAGVLIALDDFGMGHSSLAHLKYFPVDILKLDQSFVQDIGVDPKFEQLIEVIITLAHRIGARMVAEGVEDESQLNWLRSAGCDYVQGYLIGRPGPSGGIRPLERLTT